MPPLIFCARWCKGIGLALLERRVKLAHGASKINRCES